ncbi:uncharacterized protein [Rutidosis leptorrhynchoides]|uniref:uncharacterized protein isoform X2 n=1 Tax=Rutidosis leptorrhynchoides TaxID=125765 RepID=UPI003A990679
MIMSVPKLSVLVLLICGRFSSLMLMFYTWLRHIVLTGFRVCDNEYGVQSKKLTRLSKCFNHHNILIDRFYIRSSNILIDRFYILEVNEVVKANNFTDKVIILHGRDKR